MVGGEKKVLDTLAASFAVLLVAGERCREAGGQELRVRPHLST